MYYIVNPTIKTKRISRRKVQWFELRYSCDGLQILSSANDWMVVSGCFDGVDSKEGWWRWWWGYVGIFFVPFIQILCQIHLFLTFPFLICSKPWWWWTAMKGGIVAFTNLCCCYWWLQQCDVLAIYLIQVITIRISIDFGFA